MTSVVLEARDVTFCYDEGKPIVQNWWAEFHKGEMTALTGPSGRGKSTLLYLLGLMLTPSSGDIIALGQPTTEMQDANRSRLRADRFGFVFQDAALDPSRTVLDNVLETVLYRGSDREQAAVVAKRLLETCGVEVPANRKPGQVSGGQAQRIALCRALLNDPPIILADEPTGNLDPDTTARVVALLRERARSGAAVVVVTHSPEVANACDREIRL